MLNIPPPNLTRNLVCNVTHRNYDKKHGVASVYPNPVQTSICLISLYQSDMLNFRGLLLGRKLMHLGC